MAKPKGPSERRKTYHWHLLYHDMSKKEGKVQTSQDISRSRGEVPMRTWEKPQENWEPLGTIKQNFDNFYIMRRRRQGEDSLIRSKQVPPIFLDLLSSQGTEGKTRHPKKNASIWAVRWEDNGENIRETPKKLEGTDKVSLRGYS